MHIIHHTIELRTQVKQWHSEGLSVCLVPTMGNLHEGHLALVDRARQLADKLVATIFVNPMQFIQGEDYDTYPRTMDQDSLALSERGADILFAPDVDEVYPEGLENHTEVSVPAMDGFLCGAGRPGHFTGVATVVSKLFNLVQPDTAIFGQKDYQQLLVIKRMVSDLCFPIDIQSLPTVREKDGLAMSSRNGYLSKEERKLAPQLFQLLRDTADQLQKGDTDYSALEDAGIAKLRELGFDPEYLSIRLQENLLLPVTSVDPDNLVILIAAKLGSTRLIDNLKLS